MPPVHSLACPRFKVPLEKGFETYVRHPWCSQMWFFKFFQVWLFFNSFGGLVGCDICHAFVFHAACFFSDSQRLHLGFEILFNLCCYLATDFPETCPVGLGGAVPPPWQLTIQVVGPCGQSLRRSSRASHRKQGAFGRPRRSRCDTHLLVQAVAAGPGVH